MAIAVVPDPLQRSFTGRIEPVRIAPGYALALALVAVLMVALPLVYVGLIGLVAWAWWWHIVHDAAVFSGMRGSGGMKVALFLYLTPLVIGGVLIVFMLKPLLARPGRRAEPISLDPRREPRLFAFVERLCEAVGAPRPSRIDITCEVNASASFRRGWLSFVGNDLVLTVGLHLVAGQDLRQFAGVLAHEFGHFAQGWAMRASYVIWSVNAWFARVVHRRDAFDEKLVELSNSDIHIGLTVMLWLARLMVWLTRRVLWVLMLIGHLVSSLLSRQMEFDADRHAARLVGRGAFASALRELPVLCAAEQGAHADLGNAWRERRLADDLPALVTANLAQIPDALRRKAIADGLAGSAGMYASHPGTSDRIAAGEREPERGVFAADGPACQLFADWPGLCRRATLAWYTGAAGLPVKAANLVPTAQIVAAWERDQAEARVAKELIGDLWSGAAYFAPGDEAETPADPAALARELEQAERGLLEAQAAQALFAAGADPPPGPLVNSIAADKLRASSTAARLKARAALARAARAAQERLAAAAGPEADALRATLRAIAAAQDAADEVRAGFHVLAALFGQLDGHQHDEHFIAQVRGRLSRQRLAVQRLRDALRGRPNPFTSDGVTLERWLLAEMPDAQDVDGLMGGSQQVLSGLGSLHGRCLGRLAVLAGAQRPA